MGSRFQPSYVCPICDRVFLEAAVSAGELTAEHVPPDSFGGRELLLTCKACNNSAGTLLDAHARHKEDVEELMAGSLGKRLKVRIEVGGKKLNARVNAGASTWKVEVVKRANDPMVVSSAQARGFPVGEPINVEFTGSSFADLGARISWLRSGFLALFAAYGYRLSFNPALAIVKRQIREPESRLIYSFSIETPESRQSRPWSDWRILTIPEPRCTGVLFGRYLMLYPEPGDVQFYERLEADLRSRKEPTAVSVAAQEFSLDGAEPLFGYDAGSLE